VLVNAYFEMQNILHKQPSVNGNSALIVVAFGYINDKKPPEQTGGLNAFTHKYLK